MKRAGLVIMMWLVVLACRCQTEEEIYVPDVVWVDLGPLGGEDEVQEPEERGDGAGAQRTEELKQFPGSGGLSLGFNGPEIGELVVNELMVNPAGAKDTDGEYVEIKNVSTRVIDLFGLELKDIGSDSVMVTEHIDVAPGYFAVLARKGETTLNGGFVADWVYGSKFSLSNAEDEVILEYAGYVVDQVMYDDKGFNVQPGSSIELNPFLCGVVENDYSESWCPSSGTMPSGDTGTPGRENSGCE